MRGGQVVVVPAEMVHTLVNSGDDDLRLISIHPRDEMTQTFVKG